MENFSPKQEESAKKTANDLLRISRMTDPTKSSPLPDKMDLRKVTKGEGRQLDEYEEVNSKDIFLLKEEKDYENKKKVETKEIQNRIEKFVSLLSKGILHVADFTEKDGKYYSHKMPLERIAPSNQEEIQAELFALSYLFGDWDHYSLQKSNPKEKAKETGYKEGTMHYQNLVQNSKNQFNHYDYNIAFSGLIDDFKFGKIHDKKLKKEVKDYFIERIKSDKNHTEISYNYNKKTIYYIKRKMLDFKNAINDNTFFSSILEKSKINLNTKQFNFLGKEKDEKPKKFKDYLLERIKILEDVIYKI